MCSNAQKSVHLMGLVAEIRIVVAKWKGDRAAASSPLEFATDSILSTSAAKILNMRPIRKKARLPRKR